MAPVPTASDQRDPLSLTRSQCARVVPDVASSRDFPRLPASALLIKDRAPPPPQVPAEAAVSHPQAGMTAGLAGGSPAQPCIRSDVTPADQDDANVLELLEENKALEQEKQ